MIEIRIVVFGAELSVAERPVIATGNRNTVQTIFEFEPDDLWNTCEKRAVFWNVKTPSDIYAIPLDVHNTCVVPPVVLTETGDFCFGIIGLADNGEVKKVSTIIKYPLKPGAPDGTTDVVEMPPDLWEQQLAIMGEAVGAATEAIATANEALGIANYASTVSNEAVEKLNTTYVDADGYIHVFVLENIRGVMPMIHTITDENGAYIHIENMDGSIENTKIVDTAELKDAMLDAVDEEIVGGKMDKPEVVTGTDAVNITVAENTEYKFSAVSSLTMTGNFVKAHGFVIFGSSAPTISVTGFTKSGGDDVASAQASEVWEFSCDTGFIIWKNWGA